MVIKRALVTCLLATLAGSASADKYTASDLKRLLRDSEREHSISENHLKSDELHTVIDEDRHPQRVRSERETSSRMPGTPAKKQLNNERDSSLPQHQRQPNAQIGQGDAMPGDRSQHDNGSEGKKQRTSDSGSHNKPGSSLPGYSGGRSNDPDRYVPVVRQSRGNDQITTLSRDIKKNKRPSYGVRLGTIFRVELRRMVTNADSALIELHVVDDVFGDYKVLHGGTQLFGDGRFNRSTNRLDVHVTKGITPNGKEFQLNAVVLDIHEQAGLLGTVTGDGKTIERSIAAGGYDGARAVVNSLAGDSIVGDVMDSTVGTALDESESERRQENTKPNLIITVTPQYAFVRIEETF
jgi:hypothetical protein